MTYLNYTRYSLRQLYEIASRVLSRSDDVTQDDVKIATESGFVIYEIDIDGYYPSPTDTYIYWMDRFDPIVQGE